MIGEIPELVRTIFREDPAAKSVLEIVVCYPGFHAVLAHRFAHWLYRIRLMLPARMVSQFFRWVTGIEIHPGARIGRRLFIDHGMAVVIGETAEIGDDVTLYQGVTLGGTGFATGKRHPTVQDNVTIGSGAKLLGPITVGHGAKIGANSVVIHDVPPHSTVVGNPGHPVRVEGRRPEGPDADWIHLPDPVADAIKGLASRIAALESADAESAARPGADVGQRGRPGNGGPETDGRELDGRANPTFGPNPAGG
jgi:serine O-acetyltransferase